MALIVYNLLLIVLSPLILVYLLWRLANGKEDSSHWGERWGTLPDNVTADRGIPRFWVHAVSVGEVMAVAPILRELRRRWPESFILLSTTTIGGREVAMKQCPPADEVVYYPLDFPFAVATALADARPDAIVLMEWEIWPNFLTIAKRRGAKIAVLNGRISDRGLRRGLRSGFFTATALDAVDLFAMQSEEDARRAILVGADAARVRTFGNTKFDESATPLSADARRALRADLGIADNAPIWVCGSTRPGEEEILANALRIVRATIPDLVLIVAPRHLDRTDAAAAPFERGGFSVSRRSNTRGLIPVPPAANVILLDTFGELAHIYAIADVAFVGGSLLPFGGQSVFQPLAQGTPALFGPFMNNQRDIASLALGAGVGFEVRDADSLAAAVLRILDLPPAEKEDMVLRAGALIEGNRGVAARCVDAVAELLDAAEAERR